MTRHRHLDRSLREPQWPIRIVTIGILLVGTAVVLATYSRAEARRARAMERVEIGDTASRVVGVLGQPSAQCRGGSLRHLRPRFPPDWPAAAIDRAVERLEQHTSERWIYALDADPVSGCAPLERGTEIGLDSVHRVLWFVPLVGKRPLQLPPGYTPAEIDPVTEEAEADA